MTASPTASLNRWTMSTSAPTPGELQQLLRACASVDDLFTKTNISSLNKPPLLELAKAAITVAFDLANGGGSGAPPPWATRPSWPPRRRVTNQ